MLIIIITITTVTVTKVGDCRLRLKICGWTGTSMVACATRGNFTKLTTRMRLRLKFINYKTNGFYVLICNPIYVFHDVCSALIITSANKIISEEEFSVLFAQYQPENPELPYWKYDAFRYENLDLHECKAEFRFEKKDLPMSASASYSRQICLPTRNCLQWNGRTMYFAQKIKFPLSLFRHDFAVLLVQFLNYACSPIWSYGPNWVYATHGEGLTSWNQPFLSRECLESYAPTIFEKGAPLTNCFGFVDGTVRQICRPGKNQQVVYNSHKEYTPLKFQAVVLPNGIVANLFGLIEGRHHDAGYSLILMFLLPCSKWHAVSLVMFYAFMGSEHIHYNHS